MLASDSHQANANSSWKWELPDLGHWHITVTVISKFKVEMRVARFRALTQSDELAISWPFFRPWKWELPDLGHWHHLEIPTDPVPEVEMRVARFRALTQSTGFRSLSVVPWKWELPDLGHWHEIFWHSIFGKCFQWKWELPDLGHWHNILCRKLFPSLISVEMRVARFRALTQLFECYWPLFSVEMRVARLRALTRLTHTNDVTKKLVEMRVARLRALTHLSASIRSLLGVEMRVARFRALTQSFVRKNPSKAKMVEMRVARFRALTP